MGTYPSFGLRVRRRQIITERIKENKNIAPFQLAKMLVNDPEFAGLHITSVYSLVLKVIDMNGEQAAPQTHHASGASVPAGRTDAFDTLVNRTIMRIPVGAMAEVGKLLNVIREEWNKIEAKARLVPDLERKAAEHERHRCPDADGNLREENAGLKERIAFLEKRVEALSKLTKPNPQLVENALAR